jgi:predicted amidohydrolase
MSGKIKVAVAHPPNWVAVPWKVDDEDEVLKLIDAQIARIVDLAERAADQGALCVAFPEDMLALVGWQAAHLDNQTPVLTEGVDRMLKALSKKARERSIYCVACSDMPHGDVISNTAVLIGRDGQEIGRYRKVNQPFAEQWKEPGSSYPVFETEDLGNVGFAICYDMVFPEATRALALNGADVVFVPSMGGASMGSGPEAQRAAFITRAADNGIFVVVAFRQASMFISPEGEIFAQFEEGEDLTFGEFDPSDTRSSQFANKRAEIFAERRPDTYGLLTDPSPPILDLLKTGDLPAPETYWKAAGKLLTVGEERYQAAEALFAAGKREEALKEFRAMVLEYEDTWIERVSRQKIQGMEKDGPGAG